MSLLDIRIYGDPVLRQAAEPVSGIDDKLKQLAADMGDTMYSRHGIGLAAPQIGLSLRMFVVDVDWIERDENGSKAGTVREANLRVFVNPSVLSESDEDGPMNEGCLSIPGIDGEVYRPLKIRARYTDLSGQSQEEDMDGMLARCFQHELDHLNGVLFPDRMPFLKRARIAGALNRLKRRSAAEESRDDSAAVL